MLSLFMSTQLDVVYSYTTFKNQMSDSIPGIHASSQAKCSHYDQMVSLNADGTLNSSPLALTTRADNEANMFHEILKMPDKNEFVKAMVKELEDHHQRKHWIIVERKSIGQAKVIKTI